MLIADGAELQGSHRPGGDGVELQGSTRPGGDGAELQGTHRPGESLLGAITFISESFHLKFENK